MSYNVYLVSHRYGSILEDIFSFEFEMKDTF